MVDGAGWLDAVESELRAVGRDLEVPQGRDLTVAVRQRLEGQTSRRRVPGLGLGALRRRRGWRAVLVVVAVGLVVLIATPQGRAAISHVFRFSGVELRQPPGPVRSPASNPSLPGERTMPLEKARHQVSFPIVVPTGLGQPAQVVVSDGGRVLSLIYHRAPYGVVRIDEFAGQLDQIYFEKLVSFSDVTQVEVDGHAGLWIKGPHDLMYIARDGTPMVASARLTTGNTLVWGTRQVAVRLEGNLSKTTALAIANSAR